MTRLEPILDTSAGPRPEELVPHLKDFQASAMFTYQSGPLMQWLEREEVPPEFIKDLQVVGVPTPAHDQVLIVTRFRTEGRAIAVGPLGLPQTDVEVYLVSTMPPEPPGGFLR